MNNSLNKAVEIMGSQTALANAIGVKQAHVWNWINRDKKLSLERAFQIQKATNGRVLASELCPDIAMDISAA